MTLNPGFSSAGGGHLRTRLRSTREFLQRHHVLLLVYGLTLATYPLLDTRWHRNLFYVTYVPVFLLSFDAALVRQSLDNWGFRFAMAFIGYVWLSQFWSHDLDFTVTYNVTRKSLLVVVFVLGTIQLAARYERFLPGVAIGLMLTSVIAAGLDIGKAIAIAQWPPPRLEGLGRGVNPIFAALLFGIGLITAIDLLRSPGWGLPWKAAAAAAIPPLVLAFLLTQSRGPWVALIAVSALVALVERRWFALAIMLAAVSLAFLGLAAGIVDLGLIIERGDSQRFRLWQQSLEWVSQNPLFGAGYGTHLGLTTSNGSPMLSPHNVYLSVVVISGLVGAVPFFGMLAYTIGRMSPDLFRRAWRMSIPLFVFGLVSSLFDGYVPLSNLDVQWLLFWLPIAYEIGRTLRAQVVVPDGADRVGARAVGPAPP